MKSNQVEKMTNQFRLYVQNKKKEGLIPENSFVPFNYEEYLQDFLIALFNKNGINLNITIDTKKTYENLKAMNNEDDFQLRVKTSIIKGYVKRNSKTDYEIFMLDRNKNSLVYIPRGIYSHYGTAACKAINYIPLLDSAFHIINNDFEKTNTNILFNDHSLFIKDENIQTVNEQARKNSVLFAAPQMTIEHIDKHIDLPNFGYSSCFKIKLTDYLTRTHINEKTKNISNRKQNKEIKNYSPTIKNFEVEQIK